MLDYLWMLLTMMKVFFPCKLLLAALETCHCNFLQVHLDSIASSEYLNTVKVRDAILEIGHLEAIFVSY